MLISPRACYRVCSLRCTDVLLRLDQLGGWRARSPGGYVPAHDVTVVTPYRELRQVPMMIGSRAELRPEDHQFMSSSSLSVPAQPDRFYIFQDHYGNSSKLENKCLLYIPTSVIALACIWKNFENCKNNLRSQMSRLN